MKCGVYIIKHSSGKVYVGSSINIALRWRHHKKKLRKGTHENNYLQRAWNKYGEKEFEFSILELTEADSIRVKEQFWLDKLQVTDRSKGYNLSDQATGGYKSKRKCKILNCNGPNLSKGLCNKHYRRFRRHGSASEKHLRWHKRAQTNCKVPGCSNAHDAKGYCAKHGYYIRKYGRIRKPKIVPNPNQGCSFENCDKKHYSRGYCHTHYERMRYHGQVLKGIKSWEQFLRVTANISDGSKTRP
jgi:hypothetical protein